MIYVLMFVAAGYLGRATIVDGRALSLVWPAAGVAVLWFIHRDGGRWTAIDVSLLAATTFVINWSTGSSPAMGVVFIFANLAQTLGVVALLRRWSPGLWVSGDSPPLHTVKGLMRFLAAAGIGSIAGVTIGVAGLWLVTGFASVPSTVTWWGRNVSGVLGIGTTGLLIGHAWRTSRHRILEKRTGWGAWWVELIAMFAATSALFLVNLWVGHLPLAFLLPAISVWAGLRFKAVVVALQALYGGGAAVVLTLVAQGPFASVPSVQIGALLAQLFVSMTVMIGLFLAVARAESLASEARMRASEQAAAEQAEVLGAIIGSMSDGVIVLDQSGKLVVANPASERLLGNASGRHAGEFSLVHPDGTPIAHADRPSTRALGGETVEAMSVRVAGNADQQRTVLSVTATPLRTPADGDARAAVMVMRDVTKDLQHQQELGDFARVVAHDLLNPIGAVSGWAETLEDLLAAEGSGRALSPEDLATRTRVLGSITSSAERMRGLVHDLLADATSRDRELEMVELDLQALVHEVCTSREALDFVDIAPIPPVLGDAFLLRQMVDNLLGNAIKYVAPGATPQITVSGRLTKAPTPGDPSPWVEVTIADRGIGVPVGQHEAIFQNFHRVHADDYQGTGLGLAICRRNVERHGGQIVARPRGDGPGMSFVLTLPAWQPV